MPDRGDQETAVMRGVAANDNGEAATRVNAAVMTLARLIGRRIAREEAGRMEAANDNAPPRDADGKRES